MRYTSVCKQMLGTNSVERVPLNVEHYKELGIPLTPLFGMHEINVLYLVNKWNRIEAAVARQTGNPVKFFYYMG